MLWHFGHSREVFFGSTNLTGTPSRFALYSTNVRNCLKDHLLCLSRCCLRPITVALERIPLKSSNAIALRVPLALETMAFEITWLMSRLNRFSLPDIFFKCRFAERVPFFCSLARNPLYLFLIFSTFSPLKT